MKKQLLFTIAICVATVFKLCAQAQFDHPIQLTGTGSNAEITGVKTVANGQDAVNDSSVQRDILKYAAATGAGSSGSPYVVNLSPALLAGYTTGMVVYFTAPAACLAGPVYVNVNGLGSTAIKKNANIDLAAGDIASGQMVAIQYDGTNFEIQSQLANSSAPLFTHYVGELWGGGIVVAVWDSAGYERGLIAALADVSQSVQWCNSAYWNLTNGVGPSAEYVSNGTANTAAIIAQSGTGTYAASLCVAYNGGGYSDWYLPSFLEMQQVFFVAKDINKVLGDATGVGIPISTGLVAYWTSTESTNGNTRTSVFEAGSSGFVAEGSKSINHAVRPVRRF